MLDMWTVCMGNVDFFFNETSGECLNSGSGDCRDTRPHLSPSLLQAADTGRAQRSGHWSWGQVSLLIFGSASSVLLSPTAQHWGLRRILSQPSMGGPRLKGDSPPLPAVFPFIFAQGTICVPGKDGRSPKRREGVAESPQFHVHPHVLRNPWSSWH